MIFIGAPGENFSIFQPGNIMEASSINFFCRSGKLRDIFFTIFGISPDNHFAIGCYCGDSGTGRGNVNNPCVIQYFRDFGKDRAFIFVPCISDCTIFEQTDIFIRC